MLPIVFKIGPVRINKIVGDLRVQVSEDHRHLVYTGKPKARQVPISYVKMPELSSDNIKINELNENADIDVIENSSSFRYPRKSVSKEFDIPIRGCLITDITSKDLAGTEFPLFYKDVISEFNSPPEVYDYNGSLVPQERYATIVSASEIMIAHDLEPKIDSRGKIEVYWVKYTDSSGGQVYRLLQNTPMFEEAQIENWAPSKRTYVVRPVGGSFRHNILFNGVGPFYIKVPKTRQIKAFKPDIINPTQPWHLRISTGTIFSQHEGELEKYSVPEYHFQNFAPIEPVKHSGITSCEVLTDTLIRTPFKNILVDGVHHIDIIVLDEQYQPKYGYSTLESEDSRYWAERLSHWQTDSFIQKVQLAPPSEGAMDVNYEMGFIELPNPVESTDKVFIKAFYIDRSLEYRMLNLNPLHNQSLLSGKAIVYCLPESELGPIGTAINHLILDIDDRVLSYSDQRIEEGSFVVEDKTGYRAFRDANPKAMILAEVNISRQSSIEDIVFIDVRREGGVLTQEVEDNIVDLVDTYPELEWLSSNSISGKAIPVQGVLIVDVPFSMTQDGGGELTKEDIQSISERHIALGYLPLIKFHGERPKIVDVACVPLFDLVTIAWEPVQRADGYRIYVGLSPKDMTSATDVTAVSDPIFYGALRATTQTSLDLDSSFFIYVVPVKDGNEQLASDIIKVSLDQFSVRQTSQIGALIVPTPSLSSTLGALIVNE